MSLEGTEKRAESQASGRAAERRRRRRRGRGGLLHGTRLRVALGLVAALVVVLLIVAGARLYTGYRAARDAQDSIDTLQTLADTDPAALSPSELYSAESNLSDLQQALQRLDASTALPFGLGNVVADLPWIGVRYASSRTLLRIGELTSSAGVTLTDVGRETLSAFDQTGMSASTGSGAATWLDVLARRDGEVGSAAAQLTEARRLREGLDTRVLPASIQSRLPKLDRVLNRLSPAVLDPDNRHAVEAALGANGSARYLVMFENPEELRPSGGFPGTVALVTVARGQLLDVAFYDVHRLTEDYMAQRTSVVPQPWPIQQYFPQDGFLLQDATWFADFPRSGQQVMGMYAQTTWPPINGVVAVDPAVIQSLLRLLGPVTVDVDGEQRTVTADNLTAEIERQRILEYDNQSTTTHKELVALVGQEILGRIKSADRGTLKEVAQALTASADRRDIQLYSPDGHLETLLDQKHWSGRLVPDPKVPTLAVTFANVALGKSSERMVPQYDLSLGAPQDGRRQVTLRLQLTHTGTNDENPMYSGFQRWWIAVTLPQGSVLESSDRSAMPDPDTPNGGSYVVELFPGQTGVVTLTFSMPDQPALLIRRQPGVTIGAVTLTQAGCATGNPEPLNRDRSIELDAICKAP